MATRALHGFPRGWFVISMSDELPRGAVVPLRYFGRDLVAYRGDSVIEVGELGEVRSRLQVFGGRFAITVSRRRC